VASRRNPWNLRKECKEHTERARPSRLECHQSEWCSSFHCVSLGSIVKTRRPKPVCYAPKHGIARLREEWPHLSQRHLPHAPSAKRARCVLAPCRPLRRAFPAKWWRRRRSFLDRACRTSRYRSACSAKHEHLCAGIGSWARRRPLH
jgi:hypothetical protein